MEIMVKYGVQIIKNLKVPVLSPIPHTSPRSPKQFWNVTIEMR